MRRNGASKGSIETEGLGTIPVSLEDVTKPDGAPVQVALRPEKFILSNTKPASGLAVAGKMDNAAYLGERSHYYVAIDGKPEPVAVSTTNQSNALANSGLETGSPVWLSWAEEAVVVLDAD